MVIFDKRVAGRGMGQAPIASRQPIYYRMITQIKSYRCIMDTANEFAVSMIQKHVFSEKSGYLTVFIDIDTFCGG